MPDVHDGIPSREQCHRVIVMALSNHEIGGRWPVLLAAIDELTTVLHQWVQRAHAAGFDEGLGCLIAQALAAVPAAQTGN